MMQYLAAIDISSFIWEEAHYNDNEDAYFIMMGQMLDVQDRLIVNKSNVLLRVELYQRIMVEFPYAIVSGKFHDFSRRTLKFFADLGDRMEVHGSTNNHVASNPNLIKDHFTPETTVEVQYLINQIHRQEDPTIKFFTYDCVWAGGLLQTTEGQQNVQHETLVAQAVNLDAFFNKYKNTFEFSDKHERYKAGQFVSTLSCYNERLADNRKAQQLLDSAILDGRNYYNYDLENDVWVVFRPTRDNIYHAHDESDVEKIPGGVRRRFSK
jgi:hypothetical protein